jgi:hypothetical protein
MFKIQACRGDEASEGMSFKSSIQVDSSKMNMDTTSHRYSIPVEADLLVAFSTYEGQSLFISSLYRIQFLISWLRKK